MNIYQWELKKLIVLHDHVQEEAVCGTRIWRGDWTETGVEIGVGGVASQGFSCWLTGWQCFAAVSDSTLDNLQLHLLFQVVFTFERLFSPPSFSRSPLKLWNCCTFGLIGNDFWMIESKIQSVVKLFFSPLWPIFFPFIHFKQNKISANGKFSALLSRPTLHFLYSKQHVDGESLISVHLTSLQTYVQVVVLNFRRIISHCQ